MDGLPNYFDVIIVGTGMPECIIAAAAARIGKKVLHLDRNNYYGGDWASFSFDKFLDWIKEIKENENDTTPHPSDAEISFPSFLKADETLLLCPSVCKSISNLQTQSFIRDSPEENVLPSDTLKKSPVSIVVSNIISTNSEDDNEEHISNEVTEESGTDISENQTITENVSTPESSQTIIPPHQEWTLNSFIENRRKFNIDLSPKIMFSRGSLIELLISSNIARYAEFQCMNRVLTYINGHIEQVPCSRADVFSTKNVSVVEKRMLMKFLTFCLKFEEQGQQFQGFEEQLFVNFLRSKKLTPNVEHYIVHAIAMVDESCNTLQGLKATQKFLQALGRYGNSPFLCTYYGSAELPQCFCRLCAVYEGMYYLKRKVEAVILKNNKCIGVISSGQRIDCEWLVMESSYATQEMYSTDSLQSISRGILITDSSIHPFEKKENTLLKFPPCEGVKNPVTILELSSKNYVCPQDIYLVYLYCRSSDHDAKVDLNPVINSLFKCGDVSGSEEDSQEAKPNLLWSVYFNQRDTSSININSQTPDHIFLTSSPDIELDYEHAVKEARNIFEAMYPGEEFLPRAPDPEDILIENQNNPGDEENLGKIENDVNDSKESDENNDNSLKSEDQATDNNVDI